MPSSRFAQETGLLARPALVVHGGAGTFGRARGPAARARLETALNSALEAGWRELQAGGTALQAAVEAVASMEDSGLFNAGRGSTLTSEGTIETDASVMDGGTGAAGAICAASWPANPVRAALEVATVARVDRPDGRGQGAHGRGDEPELPDKPSDRRAGGPGLGLAGETWHPLLLAGAGADRMARFAGLVPMASRMEGVPADLRGETPTGPGTVGAVALDLAGHVAAATSTGGRAGQPPGRVGDSPIIGAGTWADDGTMAVSATGTGEAFIVAGFAHRVDWAMRAGLSIDDALAAALEDVSARNGTGGAIALAPSGQYATIFNTEAMARGRRDSKDITVLI
jgi:isoaspartyl peptidase/L-asparaginase-like protein (Ntn-hydrolase superfamily)